MGQMKLEMVLVGEVCGGVSECEVRKGGVLGGEEGGVLE